MARAFDLWDAMIYDIQRSTNRVYNYTMSSRGIGFSTSEEMGVKAPKDSRKLALGLWLLLLPLFCIVLLRLTFPPSGFGKLRILHSTTTNVPILKSNRATSNGGGNYMNYLISRLARGVRRAELNRNGVSCVVDPRSTFCLTTSAVRITAGPSRSATVHLTGGQLLPTGDAFLVHPYPRTTDVEAMSRTAPVKLIAAGDHHPPPSCNVTHSIPAVVFSTGGFAGNFYHSISEILMPLYVTAGAFRSHVQLVVTDYEPWWINKYRRLLARLSTEEPIAASSPHVDVAGGVHCFPAAIVGLKFHDHLACNASMPPGGIGSLDFKRFLHESLSLPTAPLAATSDQRPRLLLLLRRKSRALLNEKDVVQIAEEVGFTVVLAWPEIMKNMEEFAELVHSCSVLMGVHGAGFSNMIFLSAGAVVLQIVPLGLDWQADTYYGRRTATRFGLKYIEYKAAAEESSLYGKYPHDDPIIADPLSINQQGYNVSKPLYIDGQNVTVDISRLRRALVRTLTLLLRKS